MEWRTACIEHWDTRNLQNSRDKVNQSCYLTSHFYKQYVNFSSYKSHACITQVVTSHPQPHEFMNSHHLTSPHPTPQAQAQHIPCHLSPERHGLASFNLPYLTSLSLSPPKKPAHTLITLS